MGWWKILVINCISDEYCLFLAIVYFFAYINKLFWYRFCCEIKLPFCERILIKQLSTIVAYGRNRYLSLANQIEAFATKKMKAKTKIWLKYGNRFLEGKYDVSGDFRVRFTCLFVSSTFRILIDFSYFHRLSHFRWLFIF